MDNLVYKRKTKVTIGVLIFFIGLCILSSNYLKQKKFQVFDEMNELYYEAIVEMEIMTEELADTDDYIIEENIIEEPVVEENIPAPVVVTPIDYTKYYVGYLSIPKIDLKKGFTDIDNKYNTVNRNIEVIKPSKYPDVDKGNFIIAGHSGTSSVSFFKDLYKLVLEDEIYITYNNTEYKYIIKNIYTDIKDGDVVVRRDSNKKTLTLITCTKGDKNTQTIYIAESV